MMFKYIFCSMVITELPQDDAKKALEMLCLPVVTPLEVSYAFNGFMAAASFFWASLVITVLCDNMIIRKLSIKDQKYCRRNMLVT